MLASSLQPQQRPHFGLARRVGKGFQHALRGGDVGLIQSDIHFWWHRPETVLHDDSALKLLKIQQFQQGAIVEDPRGHGRIGIILLFQQQHDQQTVDLNQKGVIEVTVEDHLDIGLPRRDRVLPLRGSARRARAGSTIAGRAFQTLS
jgi:hypothetical protein